MLHGTTIFVLLIVTVPPKRRGSVTAWHASLPTGASWMKPGSSKPWMSAGVVVNTGSGRVGVMHGETAPGGGFAGPPFAYAPTALATSTAKPRTSARLKRV